VIAVGNDYADPRGGYVNQGGGGGYRVGSAQTNYSTDRASNPHPRSTAAEIALKANLRNLKIIEDYLGIYPAAK
jgi:hypothetical protein